VTTEPEYQSPREKRRGGGVITDGMEWKEKRLVQRKVVGSERDENGEPNGKWQLIDR
jgi:hypothetical protein